MPRAGYDHKICSKCGRVLPLSEYYRHRGRSDGLQSTCKTCDAENTGMPPVWVKYHELLSLWNQDVSMRDLAAQYGRRPITIRKWIYWYCKHGFDFPSRRRLYDKEEFIKCAQDPALTNREIAEKLGIAERTVERWKTSLCREGYSLPQYHIEGKKRWDRESFVDLYRRYTIKTLADMLGLTYKSVLTRITRCRREGYNI